MRMALSLIGLLVALLVVGWLAKSQLQSAVPSSPSAPAISADGIPVAPTVTPANAQQIQQHYRQELDKAVQSHQEELARANEL